MKTNHVKSRLQHGEPSFGTWLSLAHLHATRVLARSGFEWLTVDMEHAPVDWSQAALLFAVIADAGCVPLVRVPEGNHLSIKRALDAGAWGIVAPMVDTVEQARRIIAATKYPPVGNRSAGGGMHSLNFAAAVGDYYERANDEILVVLQIESPVGVDNAEAIARLPGCDALFIGPVDLRFQMRTRGGRPPTDAAHEALIQRVIAAGKRARKPTGIHVMCPEDALMRAQQGMQFLAVGSDLGMLSGKLIEWAAVLWPDGLGGDLARY